MVIYKIYKAALSNSFKTTFEEQEKTLAKCYADTNKLKELLKNGDVIETPLALYSKNPMWKIPKKAK